MLIILPYLCFIISLTISLVTLNTDERLVSITSFHSSSLILIIKLSAVIPALLTKTDAAPYFSLISVLSSLIESLSLMSSIEPKPLALDAASSLSITSVPSFDLDVPITVYPATTRDFRISKPIPLFAPVTSAILASVI